MNKSILLLYFALLITNSGLFGQNFTTVGVANSLGNNCWEITPNSSSQKGAIWNTQTIDLNKDFDITFHHTAAPNGADGMAFVLQSSGTSAISSSSGNTMGYANPVPSGGGAISPSLAVELDLFDNSSNGADDISQDHIAINRNGNQTSALFGPVTALSSGANITDGVCRPVRILWNASTNNLQVYFNGNIRLNVTYNIVSNVFGGNPTVYWGFTGSTGGVGCQQRICYEFANAGTDGAVCTGNTYQINASGGSSYNWSPTFFLNAYNIASPVYTPPAVGTAAYQVTVSNSLGCTDTDSIYIASKNPPTANAGADTSLCLGDTILIGSSAIAGNSYSWSPAGQVSSPLAAKTLAYPSSNNDFELLVTDTSFSALCTSRDTVSLTVIPLPLANAGPDSALCMGDCKQIGAATVGGYNYSWSPTGGLSSSTISNPIACPTSTATYYLNVTEVATSCENTDSVTLTVNPLPNADAGSDTTLCEGDCKQIGTASVGGYSYSWTPGSGLSATNTSNPLACPSGSTTYFVNVTDISTSCQNTDSVVISVNPLPAANAGSDTSLCENDCAIRGQAAAGGFSYSWTPASGVSNTTISNPVICPNSNRTYFFTVTNSSTNCSNTDSVSLTVLALPVSSAGKDTSICPGECLMIGGPGTAGIGYSWSPSTGLNNSGISNPTSCPTSGITYVQTSTDSASGCSSMDTIVVSVFASSQVNAGPDTSVCPGDSIQIGPSATGNSTYVWTPTAGLSDPTGTPTMASPSFQTLYKVICTDPNNCQSEDSILVSVNTQAVAAFTFTSNQLQVSFTDASTSAASWSWDFGDGNSSTQQNPSYTYATDSSYLVCLTVTSPDGCVDSSCQTVTVSGVSRMEDLNSSAIQIFPNPSEGLVQINSTSNIPLRRILVFDITGQLIDDLTPGAGRYSVEVNLNELPNGVYFFKVMTSEGMIRSKIILKR